MMQRIWCLEDLSVKMMKFDTSVPLKKRYKLALGEFRGVDYSSPALRVAKNHATFVQNLICEDGLNHKRHGWCEQLALGARINGIFPFEEGGLPVLLVHAGTALWRVGQDGSGWESKKISGSITLEDARSQCFVRNGVAYFIGCGRYLAYGRHRGNAAYTLVDVSEIAYVPTTTINAGPVSAENTVYEEPSDDTVYEEPERFDVTATLFDSVNLLSNRRKNEFKVLEDDIAKIYKYELDGIPLDDTTISIKTDLNDAEFVCNGYVQKVDIPCVLGPSVAATFEFHSSTFYVKFKEPIPGEERESFTQFSIEFSCAGENKINDCRFGVTFGVDGGNDRLFVSGNPRYKNKDFFSEAGDFTYFPDGNVLTVGDERSAVTGYARLSDAALAVFKEESVGDSAIYIRTGKEQAMTDLDGDTVREALFPTLAGAASEFLATPHAVANLSGDVLMLSKNGVFGIELSSNIASNERYARERGRALGTALQAHDLGDAVGLTFRGRYYLATGDGTLYVADSRYRVRLSGATDVGYEWWVWQNVPARVLAVWQDTLLFGTADGRLCAFGSEYVDRSFTELGAGTFMQSGDKLFPSDALPAPPSRYDRLTVKDDVFALLLDGARGDIRLSNTDEFCFSEEKYWMLQSRLYPGMRVYFDGEDALCDTAYVKSIDPVGLRILFVDENGVSLSVCNGDVDIRMLCNIRDLPCAITKTEDGKLQLLDEQGVPWELTSYQENEATGFTVRYEHVEPVVARWVTPVFDLGTDTERKTLLGLSVAIDPASSGALIFGFESLKNVRSDAVAGNTILDFDALDFNKFTLNAMQMESSVTRRFNERNVNYVRLFFESSTCGDCAVNGITLYYKINQTNRGIF